MLSAIMHFLPDICCAAFKSAVSPLYHLQVPGDSILLDCSENVLQVKKKLKASKADDGRFLTYTSENSHHRANTKLMPTGVRGKETLEAVSQMFTPRLPVWMPVHVFVVPPPVYDL